MTEPRLRPHPRERFDGPEHVIDLASASADLRAEPHAAVDGHRQVALFRREGITLVLFEFDAGGGIREHRAAGLVTIHVLGGKLTVRTPAAKHELGAGQILVLNPDVPHAVGANEPSTMLLSVHRVP
ncbi:MAG: cupin domain-containing protein [Gemmatimonadota bacterium]